MAKNYIGVGSQSPTSLTKPIEKVFEDAQHTGEILLTSRKLREYPKIAAKYDLVDTILADVSKNRLHEVPKEVCSYTSMEKLNCYHNVIKIVPETIAHLPCLTYLNLSRNQLCIIPSFISRLETLEVLIASHNKLVSLPEEIGSLDKLMELDVSCNEISHLPMQIGDLKSLKSLNVRSNFLQELPVEISKLNLRKIDISGNRISRIPTLFRKIETLEDIILTNNPLIMPPAHVCTKGKQHIMKYLQIEAIKEDRKRGLLNENEMKKFRKSLPPQQSVSTEEFRNLMESPDKWKRHTVLSSDSGYSTTDSIEKCGWSPQETNADLPQHLIDSNSLSNRVSNINTNHVRDQRYTTPTLTNGPRREPPPPPQRINSRLSPDKTYTNNNSTPTTPQTPPTPQAYTSPTYPSHIHTAKPSQPLPFSTNAITPPTLYPSTSPQTPLSPPTPQGPGPGGILGTSLEDEFTRELQRQKQEEENKKKLAKQLRLQQEEEEERESRRRAAQRIQDEQRVMLDKQREEARVQEEKRVWEENRQKQMLEESRRQEELRQEEERWRADDELRRQDDTRRQDELRRQDEARQREETKLHKVDNNFYFNTHTSNYNNNNQSNTTWPPPPPDLANQHTEHSQSPLSPSQYVSNSSSSSSYSPNTHNPGQYSNSSPSQSHPSPHQYGNYNSTSPSYQNQNVRLNQNQNQYDHLNTNSQITQSQYSPISPNSHSHSSPNSYRGPQSPHNSTTQQHQLSQHQHQSQLQQQGGYTSTTRSHTTSQYDTNTAQRSHTTSQYDSHTSQRSSHDIGQRSPDVPQHAGNDVAGQAGSQSRSPSQHDHYNSMPLNPYPAYRKPALSASNSFKEERRGAGTQQYRRTSSDSNQRLPAQQHKVPQTQSTLSNGPIDEQPHMNGSSTSNVPRTTDISPNTSFTSNTSSQSSNNATVICNGPGPPTSQRPTTPQDGSSSRRPKVGDRVIPGSKIGKVPEKHCRTSTTTGPGTTSKSGVPTARKTNLNQDEEIRRSQTNLKGTTSRTTTGDQRVRTIQKESVNNAINRRSSGSTSSEDDRKRATPTRTTGASTATSTSKRSGTGMSTTSAPRVSSRTATPTSRTHGVTGVPTSGAVSGGPSARRVRQGSTSSISSVSSTTSKTAGAASVDKSKRAGTVMTSAQVKQLEDYKQEAGPNYTMKRPQDHHRDGHDHLETLRKTISTRLKRSLPDNLSEALSDGVLLCHLANQIRPRSVASVHVPSPAVPKLTPAKCRRNVENFLEACRKIGVSKDQICGSSDILEEKGINRVAVTVASLVAIATHSRHPPASNV